MFYTFILNIWDLFVKIIVYYRSKRGSCAPNLTLSRVSSSNGRYLHVFIRNGTKTGVTTIYIAY